MRSELFRIPVEWQGVPLLGIGVLLAVWLVGALALLAWHARRNGFDADFWGYVWPTGIGSVAIAIAPRFAPQGIPVRGYGVMLLLAIGVGVAMAVHRARRQGIDPDTILSLVFWLFVAGIAGARAFFVIEYWEVRFAPLPAAERIKQVLQFTEGGLVVYGSLVGAAIAFLVFTRRHGLPIRVMADLLAPSLLAGLAIGRLGCLLNGCCYGGPCERPWAVTFPEDSPPFVDQLVHGELHGLPLSDGPDGIVLRGQTAAGVASSERVVAINGQSVKTLSDAAAAFGMAYANEAPVRLRLASGEVRTQPAVVRRRSLPVHPTQVYSAVNAGLLAWVLWEWFPRRRRDGEVALVMLSLYPVSRFLLEAIRTDERSFFGTGLSISQNVSLALLAAAAVGWLLILRLPPIAAPEPGTIGGRTGDPHAA